MYGRWICCVTRVGFWRGRGLERLAEVAESRPRGAADALLSLPGVPDVVGLKSAAKDLLAAVDTLPALRAAAEVLRVPRTSARGLPARRPEN